MLVAVARGHVTGVKVTWSGRYQIQVSGYGTKIYKSILQ